MQLSTDQVQATREKSASDPMGPITDAELRMADRLMGYACSITTLVDGEPVEQTGQIVGIFHKDNQAFYVISAAISDDVEPEQKDIVIPRSKIAPDGIVYDENKRLKPGEMFYPSPILKEAELGAVGTYNKGKARGLVKEAFELDHMPAPIPGKLGVGDGPTPSFEDDPSLADFGASLLQSVIENPTNVPTMEEIEAFAGKLAVNRKTGKVTLLDGGELTIKRIKFHPGDKEKLTFIDEDDQEHPVEIVDITGYEVKE